MMYFFISLLRKVTSKLNTFRAVVQLVQSLIFVFGSGHGLKIMESIPASDSMLNVEPAWDSLSLSLSFSLSLPPSLYTLPPLVCSLKS